MMDKIILKDIKLNVNIGLTEAERKLSQPILLTIIIYSNLMNVKSIDKTINYDNIYGDIAEYSKSKKHILIETFGNELADLLLRKYSKHRLKKIKIIIKKPNAIENAEYAALELVRENYKGI